MKRYIRADEEFFKYGESDARLHLAENPSTSAAILDDLAKDYTSSYIRWLVAKHPNTSIATLKRLAKDGDEEVRSGVAYNKHTPTDILNQLATDWYMRVKNNVASNPNSTAETLDILARNNPDWQTCLYLAKRPSTSTETLDYLSTMPLPRNLNEFEYYENIIKNPNASLDALLHILDTRDGEWLLLRYAKRADILAVLADRSHQTRLRVAKNPNCDVETLTRLAQDRFKDVRKAVAENPSTPDQLASTIRY